MSYRDPIHSEFSLFARPDHTRIFFHTVFLHGRDFLLEELVHHHELYMHAHEIREELCVDRRLITTGEGRIDSAPELAHIFHIHFCSIEFQSIVEIFLCSRIFFSIILSESCYK